MATAQAPLRVYKFTDARLIELVIEKTAFAGRDATELATVGITATWVSDLLARALAFGALPNDTIELGEQKEATEDKEEEIDLLTDKLKELRSAAKRALGEKSSAYQGFGFKEIDDFSDSDIVTFALVIPVLTAKHATALAAKGWVAADNTELQTLLTNLVGGLQNQKLEVGSRDSAAEGRVTEGNEIYNLLANELCEAGKGYWRTISEAKYNDYEIFNNESGSTGVVFILNVGPSGSEVVDTPGITFAPGTPIKVEVLAGGPFKTWFATNVGDIPLVPFAVTNNGEVAFLVASDIGFGPSRLILKVQNDGMVTGTIKITIG